MTGSTTLPVGCSHTSARFRIKNLVRVPPQAQRDKTNSTPLISRYKPGLPQGQGKSALACNPDCPAGPGHARVQVSLHVLNLCSHLSFAKPQHFSLWSKPLFLVFQPQEINIQCYCFVTAWVNSNPVQAWQCAQQDSFQGLNPLFQSIISNK